MGGRGLLGQAARAAKRERGWIEITLWCGVHVPMTVSPELGVVWAGAEGAVEVGA